MLELTFRICKELRKVNSKKPNNPINKWVNKLDSSEEIQMANKYMKKCSTSLTIKEMQIKDTLRFHLTLVRLATIKKTNNELGLKW
jgi:hypothetical protein